MFFTAKVLTAGMVLGLSLGAALTGVSPVQRVHAAGSFQNPLSTESAQAAIDQGARSETMGRLADADAAYRRGWWTPPTRSEAARALRSLHDRSDFSLPVDEEAVAATVAVLAGPYRRTESEHFVILSNGARSWTASRGRLLERAYHEFFRVMDRMEYPAHPPRSKLLCVLISEHSDYARFARQADGVQAGWVAGYYAGLSNRVVLYDDLTGPAFEGAFAQLDGFREQAKRADAESRIATRAGENDRAEQLRSRAADLRRHEKKERSRIEDEARAASESKMIHEAIHLIAFNSGVQSRAHEYPFWLTEGLAMAFETDRPRAAFGPDCDHAGDRSAEFERSLAQGRVIPIRELVGISEATEESSERAETLYCQTETLFDRLFDDDRMALSALLGRYLEQPAGDLGAERHVGLFTEQLGDPALVEARLGLGARASVVAQVSATPSRR
jgi:hypothetical protein